MTIQSTVTIKVPAVSPASVPFSTGGGGGGSVSIPLLGDRNVSIVVPPGGFAGFAQQTPATQLLFQRAGRVGGKRSAAKRRRKSKAKKTAAPRKRRSVKRRVAKKGSAAMKRKMAALRARRR